MISSIQQMPTLGYFNKVMCDNLGLWTSEKKDILFNVPATEKERRKALNDAFNTITDDDGSYGALDNLVSVTTELSPPQRIRNKKNKTIQDYTNHLSKEDFASEHEFLEFKQYINGVIDDKFASKELSCFASKIYSSSMMYYKEFVREHAVRPGTQVESYTFYLKNILTNLIESLPLKTSINSCSISNTSIDYDINEWPLRSLLDNMVESCNTSLYKLHQFHEFRLNNKKYSDKEIWNHKDLSSYSQNTMSKQVVDRLKKRNKIKWETFYEIIKPLVPLLSEDTNNIAFTAKAYSAFVANNIANHIHKINIHSPEKWDYPGTENGYSSLPITDISDLILNNIELVDEIAVKESMDNYFDLTKKLRLTSCSLLHHLEFPNTIEFLYNKQIIEFPIEKLLNNVDKTPLWLEEWHLGRCSVTSGNDETALHHYKKSLKAAKYLAGPLFIFLYVEICAFCKHQYKKLTQNNEEELFTRFYEPLGSDATKYAGLLGYTPGSSRNAKTLMPRSDNRQKNGLIINKVDLMAGFLG